MARKKLVSTGYSIRELEQLSGIKAHTLRIWEQRYQLLTPQRSDSNIRYYSQADLRKILNISFLIRNGYRISQLSSLNTEQITQRVQEISRGFSEASGLIESMFLAQMDLDAKHLEQLLTESISQSGLENTIRHIAYPLLRKVGIYWQTGSLLPGQEHFLSHMIRNKIIVEIEKLKSGNQAPEIVLFLPEHELHEIPLLYAHYILKKRGHRIIYLGQVVPEQDLAKLTSGMKQVALLTVITSPLGHDQDAYLKRLLTYCKKAPLMVSGSQIADLTPPKGVLFFSSPEELPNLG